MKTRLTPADQKLLETILAKARALEKELKSEGASPLFERGLADLKALLQNLSFSEDPLVQRQAELADHLHPQMSHRHFLNFILPLERILDRSLADEDFLVTTDDAAKMTDLPRRPLILVLDNLRSAFNVGSIFRMAETLRAEAIYLCGYTPGPESAGVQKTAMGTETMTETRRFERVDLALAELEQAGYATIGLETSPQAKSLYEGELPERCALVVGNERFGLDYHTLKLCEDVRLIPLTGAKNSLNVASALSVAAFEWHRQRLEGESKEPLR